MLVICSGAALVLAFLLPGHYPPWISFQQQWLAALALVGLGIHVARSTPLEVRVPTPAIVVLAAATLPLFQFLVGQVQFRSDALMSALYLAGFAVCIVVGCNYRRGAEALADFCSSVFLTASIVCVGISAYQWVGLPPSLYVVDLRPGGHPYANLAQANHNALLLCMGVSSAVYQFERSRLGPGAAALGTFWLAMGLFMTQSRVAWLFAGLILFGTFALHNRARLLTPRASILAGVICAATMISYWPEINQLLLLDESGSKAPRFTSSGRALIWPILLDAALQSPWVGYGWNQVTLAQVATSATHPTANYWFADSHNLFLDLALWVGLPVGIALSLSLCAWLISCAVRCRNSTQWFLLQLVAISFLHSMVEFPYQYAYFLLPVGLVVGSLHSDQNIKSSFHIKPISLLVSVCTLALSLVWIFAEYMQVEASYRQLRLANARIGGIKTESVPAPHVWILDGPREYHRLLDSEVSIPKSLREINQMGLVADRFPTVAALFQAAELETIAGQLDAARRHLALICKTTTAAQCSESRIAWIEKQGADARLKSVNFP